MLCTSTNVHNNLFITNEDLKAYIKFNEKETNTQMPH